MYYTIYKILNKINGKIYIGSHKTKNLNDAYMGSGKYLKRAIEKDGLENFVKEILFVYNTPEEMYAKEAELVNEDFLVLENTYNLKVGGFGGFDYINEHKLYGFSNAATAMAGRIATNSKLEEKYGVEWRSIIGKMGSKKALIAFKENLLDPNFRKKVKERANNASKCALSESAREKRKHTFKSIGHQVGPSNSQFGKMWITDGTNSKSISKFDIIPNGWRKGRTIFVVSYK